MRGWSPYQVVGEFENGYTTLQDDPFSVFGG
jgi:hypothetical protein